MDIHINARGKYFTQWVSKEAAPVHIQTPTNQIIGSIYLQLDRRIKDELNEHAERFLAVTGARVYTIDGAQLLFASEFLLISYAQIIAISPLDAVTEAPNADWFKPPPKEDA